MANTLELRRRIKAAQNISKTTRAMQMIAASKLKKAQQAVVASRPYVTKLVEVAQNLAPKDNSTEALHPYMQLSHETGKTLYVIISPDKGLCGGLVTNLIREYFKLRKDEKALFVTIGKKIEGPVAQAGKNLLAAFPFGSTLPSFAMIAPVIDIINDQYLNKKIDSVKIITTHFNSVFSQTPTVLNLLPITLEKIEEVTMKETIFEPSKKDLLPELLKRYIEMTLFQQLLESYASYNAAQMIAMQNATNNAKDIVNELQLLYNKARQEKITKEILDISSAAVAMAVE
jgi:F-type H+-transporting ATPase subunit gamma